MTEVKLEMFTFKGFELRAVNLEGQPYFVGKDVASLLGYKNTRDAIYKHVDEEDKDVAKCDTLGGKQTLGVINESGLYSLILKSKLPEAKEFKRWVTAEVLPQIRMTGGYVPVEQEDTDEEIMAKALMIAHKTITKKDEIIKQKEKLLEEQAPKVEFHDTVLTAEGSHTITSIAADYGLSGKTLNEKLHAMKIQYKQGNRWYLYQNYKGLGYEDSKTFVAANGKKTTTSMRWTNEGRLFIYEQLKQHGILPHKKYFHKYKGVGKASV